MPTYQPAPPVVKDDTVSTGKWLLYQLISLIPLAYIVMLFIWGFGDEAKNKTFRNWARSQLILAAIGIVLSIFGIILLVLITGGLIGLASDFMYY